MTVRSGQGLDSGLEVAATLLDDFARDTGLDSDRPGRRYLWTDAFAVCGFLGLHEETGDAGHLDRALRLVDRVHRTLGRHRADARRAGWISGLPEEEGEAHPTAGGLRIGKPEPERPAGEPYHPEREWDRDGQYYHYLTRWMHALVRTWRVTGEARYHRWAVELARAAHRGFLAGGRLYWKMSIDLTRPLVPSSGQHDPLDGRVTVEAIRATAPEGSDPDALLAAEAAGLAALCDGASWITHDALGVGGLLTDCLRLTQLRGLGRPLDAVLRRRVFDDAARGLRFFALTHRPEGPAAHRLAFRELGLAIGLHAAERIGDSPEAQQGVDGAWLDAVTPALPLAREIEELWQRADARQVPAWTEHEDINTVMLAVALAPDGYLRL